MKAVLSCMVCVLLPLFLFASGPTNADLTQGIALLLFVVFTFLYSLVCLIVALVSKRRRGALYTINAAISGLLTCAIIFLTIRTDFTNFGVTHAGLLVMLVPIVSLIMSIARLRQPERSE